MSFGNEFTKKVVTFRVDNSSLSQTDYKNNCSALVEGPTDDIDGSVDGSDDIDDSLDSKV